VLVPKETVMSTSKQQSKKTAAEDLEIEPSVEKKIKKKLSFKDRLS